MTKKLLALTIATIALFGGVILFKSSSSGAAILWNLSNSGQWLMPLVLVSALIDSINPCAFSILLLTISFLFSMRQLRSGILRIGGAYILGIFAVYLLIGLGILQTLHIFNTPHFMAKVGAALLIAFGSINLINEFFPSFPIKLKIPQFAHRSIGQLIEKGSIPTAFILGTLVGICEFPCTGGPYLMILGLLHDQGTYINGLGYLIIYNLIFILPLILILLITSDKALLEKVQDWRKSKVGHMHFWSGIAAIILGLIIFLL